MGAQGPLRADFSGVDPPRLALCRRRLRFLCRNAGDLVRDCLAVPIPKANASSRLGEISETASAHRVRTHAKKTADRAIRHVSCSGCDGVAPGRLGEIAVSQQGAGARYHAVERKRRHRIDNESAGTLTILASRSLHEVTRNVHQRCIAAVGPLRLFSRLQPADVHDRQNVLV